MQKLPRQRRNPLEREKRNFYVLQVIRARHGERGGVLDEDGKEKTEKDSDDERRQKVKRLNENGGSYKDSLNRLLLMT